MTKIYTETKTDTENFVVESEAVTTSKTYHKQWLIDEIARLQNILKEFSD